MTQDEAEDAAVLNKTLTDYPESGLTLVKAEANGKFLVVVDFTAAGRVAKAGESSALTFN